LVDYCKFDVSNPLQDELLLYKHFSSMSHPFAQPTVIERLIYTSRASEPMGTLDLFNLLNQCREKNVRLGVTGHLLYADGIFTQCIEGPPAAIDGLWQSLLKDKRHEILEVRHRGRADCRRFEEWAMAFSSYRYLNDFNMPGFFPLDANGVSEKSLLCSG
jgi:hypothetical protein